MNPKSKELFIEHSLSYDIKALLKLVQQNEFEETQFYDDHPALKMLHSIRAINNALEFGTTSSIEFYKDIFCDTQYNGEYMFCEFNTYLLKIITQNNTDYSLLVKLADKLEIKEFDTLADITFMQKKYLFEKVSQATIQVLAQETPIKNYEQVSQSPAAALSIISLNYRDLKISNAKRKLFESDSNLMTPLGNSNIVTPLESSFSESPPLSPTLSQISEDSESEHEIIEETIEVFQNQHIDDELEFSPTQIVKKAKTEVTNINISY